MKNGEGGAEREKFLSGRNRRGSVLGAIGMAFSPRKEYQPRLNFSIIKHHYCSTFIIIPHHRVCLIDGLADAPCVSQRMIYAQQHVSLSPSMLIVSYQ